MSLYIFITTTSATKKATKTELAIGMLLELSRTPLQLVFSQQVGVQSLTVVLFIFTKSHIIVVLEQPDDM
jgi:hypothetical protein